MKYTLFFLFVSAQTMLAQWNIGVSVMPMTSSPFTKGLDVTPKGGPSYKLLLNASYAISDRFAISSGLQYSFKTVIWDDKFWYYTVPVDGDGIFATRRYIFKKTERYRSIELPVRGSYLISSMGASSIRISAGGFAGLSYERVRDIREDDWSVGRKDVIGQFTGGAIAGLEYQHLFSKQLGLSLSPYYIYERYAREMYNYDTDLPLAFHSFGVEAGVLLRLN
jgi:hypothetical protein